MTAIKTIQREIESRERDLVNLRAALAVLTGQSAVKASSGDRRRKPMSEATKAKLRAAAIRRWKGLKKSSK